MKYVIDADDLNFVFKGVICYGLDTNARIALSTNKRIETLEPLTAEYVNEHFGSLQQDTYDKGYKDGCNVTETQAHDDAYQRGLDDAWECAKKLYLNGVCKDMFGEYFNTFIKNYTAQEAIEKLKAHKQDDKIEVGDTVDLIDAVSDKGDGIVTKIFNDDRCYIVWYDGSGGVWAKDMLVKTGRHFDIASILEEMRHD